MIENPLQILIFVLITASYFFTLKSIFDLPPYIIGKFLMEWHKKQHYKNTPQDIAEFVRYEHISILVIDIVFILFFFYFRLWESPWLRLWERPFILAIVFYMLLIQASQSGSDSLTVRISASFAFWASPLFIILLGIAQFVPEYILPTIFQWGVTTAAFLLLFSMAWAALNIPRGFQRFATLNERHKSIGESLQRLQHIANLIGNADNWRTVREAINHVDQCYSNAFNELKRERFHEADALMIQAEMEVNQIERIFQDRINLSLRDELEAHMKQATADVNSLRDEFEKDGLSRENLDLLSNEINLQISCLDKLDMYDKNLFQKLEPIEGLFREIVDTRTALRFRKNVSSNIDLFHKDVDKNWKLVQVAKNIGLNTTEAEKTKQVIDSELQMFQNKPINSSRELVQTYQLIQTDLTSFQASVAILDSIINRNYKVDSIDSGRIFVYVPKFCSTNQSVEGAIFVQYNESQVENLSFELVGTLLELQSEPNVNVSPIQGQSYGLSHFTFVGKRGGLATLTLRFKDVNQRNDHSYKVQVNPSMSEIGQNALLFGTPIGAFAVLGLWGIGIDLKEAGTIGGAVGGVSVLMIFLINYMRYRR